MIWCVGGSVCRCLLFVVDCWLFVAGRWLLVVRCPLLFVVVYCVGVLLAVC